MLRTIVSIFSFAQLRAETSQNDARERRRKLEMSEKPEIGAAIKKCPAQWNEHLWEQRLLKVIGKSDPTAVKHDWYPKMSNNIA